MFSKNIGYHTGLNMNGFIKISQYSGMREDLVQAGGGNSAFKIDSTQMAIKASGYQLSEVTEHEGYAVVNPLIIKEAFLNYKNLDEMTEEESKTILANAHIKGPKASIETFLHSIAGKYSLHTHAVVVNAIACRKEGKAIFEKLFPDALVIPYATPGVELAKAYFKVYKEYKVINGNNEPEIVFLMNHGLLVSADTADRVIELTEMVTKKLEQYLEVDFESYHSASNLQALYGEGIIWRVTDSNILSYFKQSGGAWDYCFCPDCVVFLGKKMYENSSDFIDKKAFEEFVEENGIPVVISYKNNLYIHAVSVKKAMEIQSVLSFSAMVMSMNAKCECNFLSEHEKNYLLNWDAEKYRKQMK